MVLEKPDIHKQRKYPYLTLLVKINSKWTKVINKKPETIKLLVRVEEETKLLDMSFSHDFMAMTPRAKISKMKLYQTKKLIHSKRNNQPNKKTIYRIK